MIRRSSEHGDDFAWVRDTAIEVYLPFGDYRTIIPAWMVYPGVLTFLECDDASGERRGFVLVGFYEPTDLPRGSYAADLIAIGVAPAHQAHGVGTRLLGYAIDFATLAGERALVPDLRLTVAETNLGAQRMFTRAGFAVLDGEHGFYDAGQRAIRMRRPLASR